mgnify:FL=1
MIAAFVVIVCSACPQEQHNKISRDSQNDTGASGMLQVDAGDKRVRRRLAADKTSTTLGTEGSKPRSGRFGDGVPNENLDTIADSKEKKVNFQISDYRANLVFLGNSRQARVRSSASPAAAHPAHAPIRAARMMRAPFAPVIRKTQTGCPVRSQYARPCCPQSCRATPVAAHGSQSAPRRDANCRQLRHAHHLPRSG